jgi:(4S)-4-hydroxy-5-phosphonooxypentane-2,3-dione isomerase
LAYVIVVEFYLHPGQRDAFMPLMLANAAQSLDLERHCHQFDVCSSASNDNHILLYEIYENREAFDAHLATPHFQSFNSATEAMVAKKSVRNFARAE